MLLDRDKNVVRQAWDRLSPLPGGKAIFSKLIGTLAPYSGTISAQVCELADGYARVQMADRRAVRNHLKSVHAIALVNLAEMSSGLALLYSIPDDARGILAGFEIEYLKKARGLLTAQTRLQPPTSSERREVPVAAEITDVDGQLVVRATARWLVGPKTPRR